MTAVVQCSGVIDVCNLYNMTTNQEAIRRLFGVTVDNTGNLPPQPGVYPDYSAPISCAIPAQVAS